MSAAVPPPASHQIDDGYALVAATASGPVRLSWGAAVGNAAQASVALHALGDWLTALEDWLAPDQGLDWWPVDDAGEALQRVDIDWVSAQVVAPGGAGPKEAGPLRLSLPWPALHALDEPPQALGLHWPSLHAELLLARQPLPPEDPGRLEPGAVLLLEDSFEPAWPVVLRRASHHGEQNGERSGDAGRGSEVHGIGHDADHGGHRGTGHDTDLGRPLICDGRLAWPTDSPPRRRPIPAPRLDVRMALPTPVPVPLLTGWHARDTAFPADASATLHLIAADGRDTPLAEGQLLPWGRGHALRITRVAPAAGADEFSWT